MKANEHTKPRLVSDEHSQASLAGHVSAILAHPLTPSRLYNAVANVVNDGLHIENSVGESLLSRWSESPETIAASLGWMKEAEDLETSVDELSATVARNKKGKRQRHED